MLKSYTYVYLTPKTWTLFKKKTQTVVLTVYNIFFSCSEFPLTFLGGTMSRIQVPKRAKAWSRSTNWLNCQPREKHSVATKMITTDRRCNHTHTNFTQELHCHFLVIILQSVFIINIFLKKTDMCEVVCWAAICITYLFLWGTVMSAVVCCGCYLYNIPLYEGNSYICSSMLWLLPV